MPEDFEKITITSDEVERVALTSANVAQVTAPMPTAAVGGQRSWGSVSAPTGDPAAGAPSQGVSFWLKGWVYLGLAGFAGTLLAWMLCEPSFADSEKDTWANFLMFPFMATFMSVGFGVAESVVERSLTKAINRGVLSMALGLVLGFVFSIVANVLFSIIITSLVQSGALDPQHPNLAHPGLWIGRAVAWMVFGVTGGLIYGIVGRSGKKCLYGILGGMLGAGLGGFVFDPISMLTGGGGMSRMVGMTLFGASTGIAIGLVESALKDRWLYVSGGPLAGKQFILYKPLTLLGGQQSNDIYLFKDQSILPEHASIQLRGAQAILTAAGPVFVNGQPVSQRVLRSGDLVQIGRYSFQYQEKQQQR